MQPSLQKFSLIYFNFVKFEKLFPRLQNTQKNNYRFPIKERSLSNKHETPKIRKAAQGAGQDSKKTNSQ